MRCIYEYGFMLRTGNKISFKRWKWPQWNTIMNMPLYLWIGAILIKRQHNMTTMMTKCKNNLWIECILNGEYNCYQMHLQMHFYAYDLMYCWLKDHMARWQRRWHTCTHKIAKNLIDCIGQTRWQWNCKYSFILTNWKYLYPDFDRK